MATERPPGVQEQIAEVYAIVDELGTLELRLRKAMDNILTHPDIQNGASTHD